MKRPRRLSDKALAWSKVILVAVVLTAVWLFWPELEPYSPYAVSVLQFLFEIFIFILIAIIQFVAIFWFLGRGRVYWLKPGESGVSFSDYKGNDEVLETARRIVTLIQGAKGFRSMGGELPRGLLLVGPPGTGKTWLAQAISTEAHVPFGYASAPGFQNMFFGVGNLQIMNLYRRARKLARKYGAAIVFIDEIDAIGGNRTAQAGAMGGIFGGGGLGLLNELLLQLDPPRQDHTWLARFLRTLGLRKRASDQPVVFTIAATNLAEVLDPALLRPGRFDRKIMVDLPDAEGRRDILTYYLAKVKHDPALPVERIVHDTIGYTPVALRHVINEAVILAHFDGRDVINYYDIAQAREIEEWGLRQPIRNMPLEEKRRIAFHEAGHALAQALLYPRDQVVKTTIVRYGQALGLSATKPRSEAYTRSREEIEAEVQVALAGRAAERIFLGTELTGVTSDLDHATRAGIAYFGRFGMGPSFVSIAALDGKPDEAMRKEIDAFLREQYSKVEALLRHRRLAVEAIVDALLDREELYGDEVEAIIAAHPPVAEEVAAEGEA